MTGIITSLCCAYESSIVTIATKIPLSPLQHVTAPLLLGSAKSSFIQHFKTISVKGIIWYLPITLTDMDWFVVICCPFLSSPLSLHTYCPSSSFLTSDTVRLLVYTRPELVSTILYLLSSLAVIIWGFPHVS